MTLSEKLKASAESSNIRLCKVGKLLTGKALSDEEKSYISEILDMPLLSPGRVSNQELSRVLRSEGWDLSPSAFDRHVRGTCGCFNLSIGKKIF